MIKNVLAFNIKHLTKVNQFNQEVFLRTCQLEGFIISSAGFASSTVYPRTTITMANKNKSKQKGQKGAHDLKKDADPALRPPSNINIVVIGTGGPGSSGSLLVTTETSRYLFNCGEGTQRLMSMSKGLRATAFAKVSGLKDIFITHKSWKNTGGLLGMALTLEGQMNPDSKAYVSRKAKTHRASPEGGKTQEASTEGSKAQMFIHGPPGVEKFPKMAGKYADSQNFEIMKCPGKYEDHCIRVEPIVFHHSSKVTSPQDQTEHEEPARKKTKVDESSVPETSVAYAYLCQPKSALAKINVEKCLDAGITIGPMVGQLQRGQNVTLPDGTVVRPEQVQDVVDGEKRPFLILECPSLDFLPSLTACPEISSRMKSTGSDSFALVAHMTSAYVYNSEQYQSWMKGFPSFTNHLVFNRSAGEADLTRVRVHQAMLNLVDSGIFPVLPNADEGLLALEPDDSKTGRTLHACSGLHYIYRGKEQLGFQYAPDEFNFKEIQEECLKIDGLTEQLEALKGTENSSFDKTKDDSSETKGGVSEYPKVVFLGTGSSEPNRIRGQSGVLVHLSEDTAIILDCGEDSYGQLHRFYGQNKTKSILRKVKAIFISHTHADHHLGLLWLLKEREKAFSAEDVPFTPVLLMAPIQMMRWLKFYHLNMENVTHLLRFVKHQQELKAFDDEALSLRSATFEDVLKELQLNEYTPVEVEHCKNAYGVAFTDKNGYKLVYSGDTKPCDALVKAGTNCDLLIHEATHEDDLIAHAKASKHSTFSQAINVGSRMGAKHVILTHFSQRYAYMVPFFDMVVPQNVGIAFDNMQVCPKTVGRLSSLIPPLTTLFASKLQRNEIQRIKRWREKAEDEESGRM